MITLLGSQRWPPHNPAGTCSLRQIRRYPWRFQTLTGFLRGLHCRSAPPLPVLQREAPGSPKVCSQPVEMSSSIGTQTCTPDVCTHWTLFSRPVEIVKIWKCKCRKGYSLSGVPFHWGIDIFCPRPKYLLSLGRLCGELAWSWSCMMFHRLDQWDLLGPRKIWAIRWCWGSRILETTSWYYGWFSPSYIGIEYIEYDINCTRFTYLSPKLSHMTFW